MPGAYVGVSGLARAVTDGYVGVGGVAKKVKNGFVGINGVARTAWDETSDSLPDSFTCALYISGEAGTSGGGSVMSLSANVVSPLVDIITPTWSAETTLEFMKNSNGVYEATGSIKTDANAKSVTTCSISGVPEAVRAVMSKAVLTKAGTSLNNTLTLERILSGTSYATLGNISFFLMSGFTTSFTAKFEA